MVRLPRPLRLAVIAWLALASPPVVAAHSDLVSSTVGDGDVLELNFRERIVLTFSEPLADGSQANLLNMTEHRDSDGSLIAVGAGIASAEVDGPGAAMTFPVIGFSTPERAYRIEWTSVASDGDILRGTIDFSTEAAFTPTPSPSPSPEPSASPTPEEPSAPPSERPSPSLGPTPGAGSASATADVLLPIVIALVVVGAGGAFLLNRRRPTSR